MLAAPRSDVTDPGEGSGNIAEPLGFDVENISFNLDFFLRYCLTQWITYMIHTIYIDFAILGWVAFFISVVLSAFMVAWHFKSEADKARQTLASSQIFNSERASLIRRRSENPLNSTILTQYHQICSEDELEEDDSFPVIAKNADLNSHCNRYPLRANNSRRYVLSLTYIEP